MNSSVVVWRWSFDPDKLVLTLGGYDLYANFAEVQGRKQQVLRDSRPYDQD